MSEASEPAVIEPGIYEHFKGARYEVLFVARHSETEEEFVVYRQLYGDHAHWVDLYTTSIPRCDCGDHIWRERICKHILAALLREGNDTVVRALGTLLERVRAAA